MLAGGYNAHPPKLNPQRQCKDRVANAQHLNYHLNYVKMQGNFRIPAPADRTVTPCQYSG